MRTPGPRPQTRDPRRRSRRGFTLIEAALTTVIVGTGVLAIVAAQQAYHQKNDWAQRSSTAMLLANELRELTLPMPQHDPITGDSHLGPEPNEPAVGDYDDLDDFAGTVDVAGFGSGMVFSPPINALRQSIDDMDRWTQEIRVENVLPGHINATFAQPLGTTDVVRVTVEVKYQASGKPQPQTMSSLTWIVTD